MTYERGRGGRAFWLSVFVGGFAGVTLQLIMTTWREPVDASKLWVIPAIILAYGSFALPFVAVGLAIFGLPAAGLLRRNAQDWWVGLIAASWGAIAGKLMFYAIDHLIFFGFYDIRKVSLLDMGLIYGVPTGLAWWGFYRRELARH